MMFTAACPSGWTRFAALDGKVAKGNNTYGATGGAKEHSHPYNENFGMSWGFTRTLSSNNYSFDSTASSWPPYLEIIFCQKN